tara:strand:- start:233 stop:463 length:231 start_codon:yes stop_codon:yes gene_type:complete
MATKKELKIVNAELMSRIMYSEQECETLTRTNNTLQTTVEELTKSSASLHDKNEELKKKFKESLAYSKLLLNNINF